MPSKRRSISIELTRRQVACVLREGGQGGDLASLLRVLTEDGTLASSYKSLSESPRLSRSLLLGLRVLATFPRDGRWLAVTDLATRLDMSSSTTHRYATTLLAVGLLEQDPLTRRYRLPAEG